MSERVRVVLNEGGLKAARHMADEAEGGQCEHRLTREGGFGSKLRQACAAVRQAPGVAYAYTSPELDGGTIFYGLTADEPTQYASVARAAFRAVRSVL